MTFFIIFNLLIILSLLYAIYSQKLLSFTSDEVKPFLDQLDPQHEKRIRKFWLVSFLLAIAFTIITNLIEFIGLELGTEATSKSIFNQLITILAQIPVFWMLYYCAYKKKGTALLMLSISIRTIILVMTFFEIWNHTGLLDPSGWLFIALLLPIDVFFLVTSINLYKVNSKVEYQIVLALKHKYGVSANGFCL